MSPERDCKTQPNCSIKSRVMIVGESKTILLWSLWAIVASLAALRLLAHPNTYDSNESDQSSKVQTGQQEVGSSLGSLRLSSSKIISSRIAQLDLIAHITIPTISPLTNPNERNSKATTKHKQVIKIATRRRRTTTTTNDTQQGENYDMTVKRETRQTIQNGLLGSIFSGILHNPRHPYAERHREITLDERQMCMEFRENGLERSGPFNLGELVADLALIRKISQVFQVADYSNYDHFGELKASTQDASELNELATNQVKLNSNKQIATSSNSEKNNNKQVECVRQLDRFVARARGVGGPQMDGNLSDHNMALLLDTLGYPSPGWLDAVPTWTGDYESCRELKIRDPMQQVADSDTRFCWAGLRPPLAKAQDQLIMMGLCLPSACDSSNFSSKFDLLLELAKLRIPMLKQLNNVTLGRLYCLPDEKSPLRSIWNSKSTLAFLGLLASWLSYLVYCSTRSAATASRWHANFSLERNLNSLFKISPPSSPASASQATRVTRQLAEPDFSCLDGIKVLSSIYIMMGHVIMCLSGLIMSCRSMMREHPAYVLSNQMPAFAVNVFFCITGLLTCYQLLSQHKKSPFIYERGKWFALLVVRYLRIMPMYLLVVAYAKLLAKYTSYGPYWDYATSDKSMRRVCEQESWLATLLFASNLKHPFDHCIPSAWYLANDFQFFLVTPILICLLDWKPKWGKLALKSGAIASFLSGFCSIYFAAEGHDLTPIAKFMPHAFKTYVTLLTDNYTHPHNRISAYLIGILLGNELFEYFNKVNEEDGRTRNKNRQIAEEPHNAAATSGQCPQDCAIKASHPEMEFWWAKWGCELSVIAIAFFWLIPTIGARLPMSARQSRLLFALIMPTYHVAIATSLGALILAVATGRRKNLATQFLSANFWRAPARMSLSVMLINIEVINYIVQSQRHSIYFDNHQMVMFTLYSVASVYLLAVPFTICFEAPLRGVLNLMLERRKKSATGASVRTRAIPVEISEQTKVD